MGSMEWNACRCHLVSDWSDSCLVGNIKEDFCKGCHSLSGDCAARQAV